MASFNFWVNCPFTDNMGKGTQETQAKLKPTGVIYFCRLIDLCTSSTNDKFVHDKIYNIHL